MPPDTDESKAVRYLSENGPSPRPTVPGNLTSEGVRNRTNVLRLSSGGNTTGIVYLDEHDPGEVVEQWIRTNRETADGMATDSVRRRLLRAAPDDWSETVTDILDANGYAVDHSERGRNEYDNSSVCPICNADVSDLASHLQGHD